MWKVRAASPVPWSAGLGELEAPAGVNTYQKVVNQLVGRLLVPTETPQLLPPVRWTTPDPVQAVSSAAGLRAQGRTVGELDAGVTQAGPSTRYRADPQK